MAGGNNIESLRLARGWSRPELGKRMNTSGQQVERLEKGQRRLSQEWIERAAEAFGVEASDILPGAKSVYLPAPDVPRLVDMTSDETVEIAMLDLSFSMGPGTSVDDYIEEMPVRFDLSYVRRLTRTSPDMLRLAHGIGDSMFPTLLSSDQVWIDTTQRNLTVQDKVWAISLFGAAAIKRLRTIGPNRVLVISDNPAVDNQEVSADDLIIGGRVFRLSRQI
jgi:phage repressor protein C with HTH and peptisase S24 domain